MEHKNPRPRLEEDVIQSPEIVTESPEIAEYIKKDNVYFAFIDVLGFKQTFEENRENKHEEFAKKYENTFRYYSHLINKLHFLSTDPENICGAGQTSDSLYFYTTRRDYLVKFIHLYLHFSLYAMCEKVFFRGGIGKGSLFISQPYQFYGDSVIKAYLLESDIAKLPRLAIDGNTHTDLKDIESIAPILEERDGRYFIRPFDKIGFTDLLQIVGLDENDVHFITEGKWNAIGDTIRENRDRFEFNQSNFQKYTYLLKNFEETAYPYK